MTPLVVGSKGRDFTAQDQQGASFTLSKAMDGRPALLVFYPADWGFICRNEIVEFRNRYPEYESLGIKVIGISTNMVVSHGLWSDLLRLPFPLISDPPGNIAAAYDVLDIDEGSFNKGRCKRSLFLLDSKMIIRYVWIAENQWLEPDYDAVFSACKDIFAGVQ